jgi:osmotically inducible lipoprotein OsmB
MRQFMVKPEPAPRDLRYFSHDFPRLEDPMRNLLLALAAAGAAVSLSACGHTTEQKAATGAVAGAVVGGPVGAAVGGAAGAAVGHVTDDKR